jgi:trehalose 6-phosphate synthase
MPLRVPRRPLVVLANRLPVKHGPDGWQASSGGLVTALRPVMDETGGAWIGWDDDAAEVPARVEGSVATSTRWPSPPQVHGHYHGFSNRTIWPLFHDLVVEPVIERRWWRAYQEVNRRFAEAAAAVIEHTDRAPCCGSRTTT